MELKRFPVFREITEIFSSSYNLILQSPRLLIYSFIFAVLTEVVSLINSNQSMNIVLRGFGFALSIFGAYCFYIFTNYCIFHVYQKENIVDSELDILQESRNCFWKMALQSLFGILIASLVSIPVFGVGALTATVFKSHNFIPMIVLYFIGLIFFGIISIAQRVLLDKKTGIVKSTMAGLKALSLHQSWYFYFYLTYSLCSSLIFWSRGIIGSLFTGVDLLSVPIVPIFPFLRNYAQATSHWSVRLIFDLLGVFSFPLFSFLITYAYLNRRKYEAR